MIFIILSVLDVIAGAAIYSSAVAGLLIKAISALALIILGKGLWTMFTTIASGYPFHAWAGILDIIAGIALVLMTYNVVSASHVLGGVVMTKGTWYLIRSILKF